MSETIPSPEQNISTVIPIIIGFPAIEEMLRKTAVGEVISKIDDRGRKSDYAKILDISLSQSADPEYDLMVGVKLQTLTFLYRDRELQVFVDVSLAFDSELQKIGIEKYRIDSKGISWLADQLLESVVNNFMYERIKTRMNFDLMPQIQEQVNSLNNQLANRLETKEGIHITGSLDTLEIINMQARETALWIFLKIIGFGVVEIEKLDF